MLGKPRGFTNVDFSPNLSGLSILHQEALSTTHLHGCRAMTTKAHRAYIFEVAFSAAFNDRDDVIRIP
jgi:hypothetical protein